MADAKLEPVEAKVAPTKTAYRAPLALIEAQAASFAFDASDKAIAEACRVVSEATGQVIAPEVWEVSLPRIDGALVLPKWPVLEVLRIRYFDVAGNEHEAEPAHYYRTLDGLKTVMRPKARRLWPNGADRPDAITVTFRAGYTELTPALDAMIGALLK